MKKRIMAAGHRGYSQIAPENTMIAFRYCFEHGIPGIEIDLRTTVDGEFIVMHDPSVDRTTNGSGYVESMTLAQIRTLDAGAWKDSRFAGEKVPTIREALEYMKGRFSRIYLEIKGARDFTGIYKLVEGLDMLNCVVFHSFLVNFEGLRSIRMLDGDAMISILTSGGDFEEALSKGKAIKANEICIYWNWLRSNPDRVAQVHGEDMIVSVWGPKTTAEVDEAIDMGIDSIIMDEPGIVDKDKILNALGDKRL